MVRTSFYGDLSRETQGYISNQFYDEFEHRAYSIDVLFLLFLRNCFVFVAK